MTFYVTCYGWAMLSDNEVRVMTSSLTPTSHLSSHHGRERTCVRYAPHSSVHHSVIITPVAQLASVWAAYFIGRQVR